MFLRVPFPAQLDDDRDQACVSTVNTNWKSAYKTQELLKLATAAAAYRLRRNSIGDTLVLAGHLSLKLSQDASEDPIEATKGSVANPNNSLFNELNRDW